MPTIPSLALRPIESGPVTPPAPVKPAASVQIASPVHTAAPVQTPQPSAASPTNPLAAGPVRSLAAPVDASGRQMLPSLTLYAADGTSKTTIYKPSDMGKEQIVESVKEAAGIDDAQPCQTCANRRYTDGSNDPGVSYKTPTKISPARAASAVAAHEQEHVMRNAAEARREDRKVIASSVTLHMDVCPECGKSYVAGGSTRTTTVNDRSAQMAEELRGALLDQAV